MKTYLLLQQLKQGPVNEAELSDFNDAQKRLYAELSR